MGECNSGTLRVTDRIPININPTRNWIYVNFNIAEVNWIAWNFDMLIENATLSIDNESFLTNACTPNWSIYMIHHE